MKVLALILLFVTNIFLAQENKFTIDDRGLTNFVVRSVPNVPKELLYKKVINWVNIKFNTPQKVIKGTIENEYIRIEAISNNALRYPALGGQVYGPLKYEIEISVKDNKYKFDVINIQEKNYMYPDFSRDEYINIDLTPGPKSGYNPVRKANGEFRNRYRYVNELAEYFNYLNDKLGEYLLKSPADEDNW